MLWREGTRRAPAGPPKGSATDVQATPAERASPGLAALFESLREGGDHSVLDLGPARGRHLQVLMPFGRQVRFAGLVPQACVGEAWAAALRALPPNTSSPYDVVLGWDVLNRLDPGERAIATARLAEITAPRARLFVMVEATGASTTQPLEYTLVGTDRVAERAVGPPPAGVPPPTSRAAGASALALRGGARVRPADGRAGGRRQEAGVSRRA